MTIYAIVDNLANSKSDITNGPLWTVISASAILQGGNPYFVPDFAGMFEARCAIALRIGKLGKSIAPRFAHRYVDAVAPATLMLATDLLESLRAAGLPWSKAISYDRSVAIGSFTNMAFEEIPNAKVEMDLKNDAGEDITTITTGTRDKSIGEIISELSRDNALKTGDIILAGIRERGPELHPGQRMVLKLNGTEALKYNIR